MAAGDGTGPTPAPAARAFQTGIWVRGGWAAAQCQVGLRSQVAPCAGPGGGGTSLTNLRVGELGAEGGTSLTTAVAVASAAAPGAQRLVTPLPRPAAASSAPRPAAVPGWDFAHDRGRAARDA